MIGTCFSEKHRPYDFARTLHLRSCKGNIMNCVGIFKTPSSGNLAVHVPTSCKRCLIWEEYNFLSCIFIQHWTKTSKIFRSHVYCSLTCTVDCTIVIAKLCVQQKTFLTYTVLLYRRHNTQLVEHLMFNCR